jgi:RND family efflux transporter MFP subunit
MKNKWLLWLIPALLMVFLGLWKNGFTPQASSVEKNVDSAKTVIVREVDLISKDNALELPATLEAGETAVISPKVSGRVAQVLVENGHQVSAGKVLVTLDTQDYNSLLIAARADLKKAEANLAAAHTDYQRFKQLHDSSAISDKDLQDIELACNVAEADAEAAAAAVESASISMANTTITTPIQGVVSNKNVSLGQMLSIGQTIMTVEDISYIYALVNVQQKEIANLKPGLKAEVTLDAYGTQKFSGVLEIINPSVSVEARVFQAKIRLDNPDLLLHSGMFAQAKIYTGEIREITAIPRDALISLQDLNYVFILDGESVKQQQVQTGAVMDDMVEIISGLQLGQSIIVSDVSKLKDRDRVQAIREQEE